MAPAVSQAILVHNRGRTDGLADGVVITPSQIFLAQPALRGPPVTPSLA
jgi:hypothetical protein